MTQSDGYDDYCLSCNHYIGPSPNFFECPTCGEPLTSEQLQKNYKSMNKKKQEYSFSFGPPENNNNGGYSFSFGPPENSNSTLDAAANRRAALNIIVCVVLLYFAYHFVTSPDFVPFCKFIFYSTGIIYIINYIFKGKKNA
jgi:predicted RNA-binding Zn-ribbon protein involved in translation (DUF1610 family)